MGSSNFLLYKYELNNVNIDKTFILAHSAPSFSVLGAKKKIPRENLANTIIMLCVEVGAHLEIFSKTMFPPGLEPGTFRVLGERDNHYTTETWFLELSSN